MSLEDLDDAIERYHAALNTFVNGDPAPVLEIFSERDDVTLANPLGPTRRGRTEVEEASEAASANFKSGTTRFEEVSRYTTEELAYVHDVQRTEAQMAASEGTARSRCGSQRSSDARATPGRSRTVTLTP